MCVCVCVCVHWDKREGVGGERTQKQLKQHRRLMEKEETDILSGLSGGSGSELSFQLRKKPVDGTPSV